VRAGKKPLFAPALKRRRGFNVCEQYPRLRLRRSEKNINDKTAKASAKKRRGFLRAAEASPAPARALPLAFCVSVFTHGISRAYLTPKFCAAMAVKLRLRSTRRARNAARYCFFSCSRARRVCSASVSAAPTAARLTARAFRAFLLFLALSG